MILTRYNTPEIWKPIEGYEDWYDVSNHGRVRSWKKPGRYGGKLSEPQIIQTTFWGKYRNFAFSHNGVQQSAYVHSLVAEVFLGPRPDGYQINHKNGKKDDNRPENLEYVTPSGNNIHARDNLNRSTQILSRQQAEEIIALLTKGKLTQVKIGAIYRVESQVISRLWTARTWADIPRLYPHGITYTSWMKMQREKREATDHE
jgi:hypothetical protein